MTTSITVADLQNPTSAHGQFVDVRSPSEFAAGHIPRAINIPLDQIESRLDDLDPKAAIVLICQMGKRARMAAALLDPCRLSVSVLEGGTKAWVQAGLPLVRNTKTRWSLERQVRLGAGLLVLLGAALALTLNVYWLLLCGFAGLGLTFAGLTDICPMAEFLVRMPWNANSHYKLARGENAVPARPQ